MRAFSVSAAAALILAGCGATTAPPHATTSARARPVTHPHAGPAALALTPAPLTRSTLIGVGNVSGCMAGSAAGLPVLRTYRATIVRVVIDPRHGIDGQAAPCLRAAVAAGYRVHVAISYDNTWPMAQIVSYFRHVLASYAPFAWAISIGNEQELNQGGAKQSGAQYAATWRAVEPVVARLAPHAIRVGGEISPWGSGFLRAAYAAGLPGVQAIAAHAYRSRFGFDLPKVIAWAHSTGSPLWITEGLDGPGAWPSGRPDMHAIPLSALRGVAVADAWLG